MTERTHGVLPLSDVRIISLEQYGAGPYGTLHLADLGAEIIKVEHPERGDVGRQVPPKVKGDTSLFFESFNRNKQSISLDITRDSGRSVFEELVSISDVVFANVRGDLPKRLRIRYQDLAHINERIVSCTLTGYGRNGPRAPEPGYDYIVQGLAGWMTVTGAPGSGPQKTGFSLVDYSTGLVAALAIMVGVHAARRDGVGGDADVSLFDTALSMIGYPATWILNGEDGPTQTSNSAHPSIVPFQNFPTRDGWIVVACPKEKFFHNLCLALEKPEWLEDPRFSDFQARRDNREELIDLLSAEFVARTSDEWLEILTSNHVPCGPINDVHQGLIDPQVSARGLVVDAQSSEFGSVRSIASPVRYGVHRETHTGAPGHGRDTEQVMHHLLGYDEGEISELRETGALGAISDERHINRAKEA